MALKTAISRAFTLLEVLCALAVLAILLVLIMGGYHRVTETALGARNLANHRFIAQGLRAFAQDHKGELPFGNDYDPPFGNGASSSPNGSSPYPKTLCILGYISDGRIFFSPRFSPRWEGKAPTPLVIANPTKYMSAIVPWGYTNYGVNRYGAMPISTDNQRPANLIRVGADGNLSKLILTRDTYDPSRDSPSMRRGGGFVWFANKANIPPLEDCYAGMVHASFADGHVEVFPREAMVKLMESSGSAPLFSNIYTIK